MYHYMYIYIKYISIYINKINFTVYLNGMESAL